MPRRENADLTEQRAFGHLLADFGQSDLALLDVVQRMRRIALAEQNLTFVMEFVRHVWQQPVADRHALDSLLEDHVLYLRDTLDDPDRLRAVLHPHLLV